MSVIISHTRENHVSVKRILQKTAKITECLSDLCRKVMPNLSFFFLLTKLVLGTVHKSLDICVMQ